MAKKQSLIGCKLTKVHITKPLKGYKVYNLDLKKLLAAEMIRETETMLHIHILTERPCLHMPCRNITLLYINQLISINDRVVVSK